MLKKNNFLKVVFVHKNISLHFELKAITWTIQCTLVPTYLVVKKIVQSHNVSLAEYSSTFYIDFFKIDSTL